MERDTTGRVATTTTPAGRAVARAPQVKGIQQVLGNRGTAQLLRTPEATAAPPASAPRTGPPPARARQRARFFVRLWANGQPVCLPGDGEAAFEVYGFRQGATVRREAGSGQATGRRQYSDVTFNKPIDELSPLILKALTENQTIRAEVDVWSGETLTQTLSFSGGRISGRELGVDSEGYDNESVSFTFQTITQTAPNGGVTQEDTATANH